MGTYLGRILGPRLLELTKPDDLGTIQINIWNINDCHISKDGKHTVLTYGDSQYVTTVLESTEFILNIIFKELNRLEEEDFDISG